MSLDYIQQKHTFRMLNASILRWYAGKFSLHIAYEDLYVIFGNLFLSISSLSSMDVNS
jgi:hypothetical protein